MNAQKMTNRGAAKKLWRSAAAVAILLSVAILTGDERSAVAASEGDGHADLSAFEQAKADGGPFGGAIAGLPKDVCLEDQTPGQRYWQGEGLLGFPILLGPRDRSEGLSGVDEDESLFRVCRPFNTGLDD